MKKLILFLSLLFISKFTFAQVGKGTTMLGGAIHFERMNQSYKTYPLRNTHTAVRLEPQLAYFILDRLVLGATLQLEYWRFTGNREKSNNYMIGLGPLVRYYLVKPNKAGFFLHGQYNYNYMFSRTRFDPSFPVQKSDYHQGRLRVGPGLGIYIRPDFAFEVKLYYEKNHHIGQRYRSANINAVGFDLGFQFFLPSNK